MNLKPETQNTALQPVLAPGGQTRAKEVKAGKTVAGGGGRQSKPPPAPDPAWWIRCEQSVNNSKLKVV
jgi:hypothetical protein